MGKLRMGNGGIEIGSCFIIGRNRLTFSGVAPICRTRPRKPNCRVGRQLFDQTVLQGVMRELSIVGHVHFFEDARAVHAHGLGR